jgi:hypothetical protein
MKFVKIRGFVQLKVRVREGVRSRAGRSGDRRSRGHRFAVNYEWRITNDSPRRHGGVLRRKAKGERWDISTEVRIWAR